MGILMVILTAVEVIVALLLIGIILIQQTRSGGGLGALGGGVTDSVFGAGAGNFLTKTTVILSAVFFVVTLSLVWLAAHGNQNKSVVEKLAPPVTASAAVAKPAVLDAKAADSKKDAAVPAAKLPEAPKAPVAPAKPEAPKAPAK